MKPRLKEDDEEEKCTHVWEIQQRDVCHNRTDDIAPQQSTFSLCATRLTEIHTMALLIFFSS